MLATNPRDIPFVLVSAALDAGVIVLAKMRRSVQRVQEIIWHRRTKRALYLMNKRPPFRNRNGRFGPDVLYRGYTQHAPPDTVEYETVEREAANLLHYFKDKKQSLWKRDRNGVRPFEADDRPNEVAADMRAMRARQ